MKKQGHALNKLSHFTKRLNNLGKESYNSWYVEVEYFEETDLPTQFKINFTSHFDKHDVGVLIQHRFKCMITNIQLVSVINCGDIINIK